MRELRGLTIAGSRICLDNCVVQNCEFTECVVVLNEGVNHAGITDNIFQDCVFEGDGWGSVVIVDDPEPHERARALLKRLLTPAQWAAFEACGIVTERIRGAEYTLGSGQIGVRRPTWFGKQRWERWCVNPEPGLPFEDCLIAQLLHLRADPAKLRKMANVFPRRAA